MSVSGGGELNTSNNTASDATTVGPVADLAVTKAHAGHFTRGQTGHVHDLGPQRWLRQPQPEA